MVQYKLRRPPWRPWVSTLRPSRTSSASPNDATRPRRRNRDARHRCLGWETNNKRVYSVYISIDLFNLISSNHLISSNLIYLYRCIRNEGIKRPCDRTNDDRPADLEYSMFKQTYTTTYHHTYIYIYKYDISIHQYSRYASIMCTPNR